VWAAWLADNTKLVVSSQAFHGWGRNNKQRLCDQHNTMDDHLTAPVPVLQTMAMGGAQARAAAQAFAMASIGGCNLGLGRAAATSGACGSVLRQRHLCGRQ
jgi:hypothetical protein